MVADINGSGKKGQWLTAFNHGAELFGSKFSAVFPNNPGQGKPASISNISLYSMHTGDLVAIIEANALTAQRTAASAALATDLLARKDASRLAIIGSGLQAFDQVLAIRRVRDIRDVLVFDRDPTRIAKFAEHLEAVAGWDAKITKAQTADAAVCEADIICTCTTSSIPVFSGSSLKPGTHVNAIGSYSPDMQEIDVDTVIRADCIVTEHVDGLWAAAGDILDPFNRGLISKSKVSGGMGDLLNGTIPSRLSDSSITLYESVGSAALYLAVATEAYRQIEQQTKL